MGAFLIPSKAPCPNSRMDLDCPPNVAGLSPRIFFDCFKPLSNPFSKNLVIGASEIILPAFASDLPYNPMIENSEAFCADVIKGDSFIIFGVSKGGLNNLPNGFNASPNILSGKRVCCFTCISLCIPKENSDGVLPVASNRACFSKSLNAVASPNCAGVLPVCANIDCFANKLSWVSSLNDVAMGEIKSLISISSSALVLSCSL